jgi:hypothetical protein
MEMGGRSTDRMRKLLTMAPSTPVTNDGPISDGNVVAVGFAAGVDEGPGRSKAIWAIATWSRTSNVKNRLVTSLCTVVESSQTSKNERNIPSILLAALLLHAFLLYGVSQEN